MGCFSNPKSTAASTPTMPDWMSQTLQQNSVRATGLSNVPFQPYTGQLTAPMNAVQGAATSGTAGLAATNVLNGAGNNGTISGMDLSGYMNPYTQNVINASDANLDKQYGKAAAALGANGVMAAGFGGFGDRQASAEAELASNYALQKNQLDSNLYAQNYGNAQQVAQQGVQNQLQGNIASAGIQQAANNSLFNQGTVGQATDQAANDANYAEFMRQLNDPYSKLAYATQISTGSAPFFTGQTTTSQVGAPGALQIVGGLMGGIGGGAGLAGFAGGGDVGARDGRGAGDDGLEAILNTLSAHRGYQRGGEIPDQRALNAETEAERQRLYSMNLPPDELSARLADLSARRARANGIAAGIAYREPDASNEQGAWTSGLPRATGAVPTGIAGAVPVSQRGVSGDGVVPEAPQEQRGLGALSSPRPAPPSGFDERVLDMLGRQQQSDADPQGWQARMSSRLTDPNYAFSRFLLRAGLGTLAATGMNGLAAIGQGVSHGLQAAEREGEVRSAQEAERMNGAARLIQQHRLGLGAASGNPTEIERMYRRIRELEQAGQGESPEARALRQRVSKLAGGEEGGLTANQLASARARARNSAEQEAGRLHFPDEESRRAWIEDRTEQSYRSDIGASADNMPAYIPQHHGPAPVPREAVPAGHMPDWQSPGQFRVQPDSRDLSDHERDLFVNAGAQRDQMNTLAETFRPEYTALPGTGWAQNALGDIAGERLTPQLAAQAEWWRKYNEWKNAFRNSLFGASLTEGEKRAFEQAVVQQSMDAKQIEKFLADQRRIIESAIRRRAGSLAARGTRRVEMAEAVGLSPDELFALSPTRLSPPAAERNTPARRGEEDAPPAARALRDGESTEVGGYEYMRQDGRLRRRLLVPQRPPAAAGGLGAAAP